MNTAKENRRQHERRGKKKKAQGADGAEEEQGLDTALFEVIKSLKKGQCFRSGHIESKEGKRLHRKRYNSVRSFLAMENAGQLIERGTGSDQGQWNRTSATLQKSQKKAVNIKYLSLNKKT